MDKIPPCRAAYLIPFIDVLHDIGAPVERELAKAKLPITVEETPEEFVSNILAMEFLARSAGREGVDDLGWLWAQKFSASNFSTELRAALRPLPTVKARLDCLSNLIALEDSDTRVGVIGFNGSAEIYCDAESLDEPIDPISEWTQVTVLMEVVRSITGEYWLPDEIRFKSIFSVCDAAREANPNTRFLTQSPHTSIIMPSSVLAASMLTCKIAQEPNPSIPDKLHGMEYLKRLIRPYLRRATPKIELLAEVMGVSPRSLQRKLKQLSSSYSELIDTTRFEMATDYLMDPDIPLIDIAMMFGYENQSNFGRSFRRVAGMTPGRYRQEMLGPDRATSSGAIGPKHIDAPRHHPRRRLIRIPSRVDRLDCSGENT